MIVVYTFPDGTHLAQVVQNKGVAQAVMAEAPAGVRAVLYRGREEAAVWRRNEPIRQGEPHPLDVLAVELYNAGQTLEEIGRDWGVTRQRIHSRLVRAEAAGVQVEWRYNSSRERT